VIRRAALLALALLVAGWGTFGLVVRLRAAPRPPPPPGELRGAWHVHTTHSDGREPLAEVVRAARAAGMQFLVVADHNVVHPEEAGWRDGVLVIEAHESSTRLGHLVAPGAPRALGPEERTGEPLEAIAALGGQAVLAHPFHATRPFRGWGKEPWRGLEAVSNDTAFGEVAAGRATGRLLLGLATLPFDGGQAVAALLGPPSRELAALDGALRTTPAGPRRADGRRAPGRVLFCAADAHGWPSYQAAFEAFSMHVPVTPTGDGARDGAAVLAALLDGRAACVVDAVAPAAGVRLEPDRAGGVALRVDAALPPGAEVRLLHDGAPAGPVTPVAGGWRAACGGPGCAGTWRAEAWVDGRPWIFTNPAVIE
jgi:hypothetical protein